MKNIKIGQKLILGFLTVAVLSALVGGFSIYGLQTLSVNETSLYDYAVIGIHDATNLVDNTSEQRVVVRDIIIHIGETEDLMGSISELEALEKEFTALSNTLSSHITDETRNAMSQVETLYNTSYRDLKDKVIAAALLEDQPTCEALLNEMVPTMSQINAHVDSIVTAMVKHSDEMQATDTSTANTITTIVIVLLAVAIVAAITLALYNSRSIAGPLSHLTATANRIAVGDTDVQIAVDRKDEVGMLSEAFLAMVTSVKEQAVILESLADGDFRQDIPLRSEQDMMNRAIQNLIDSNNSALAEIGMAASQVSAGARQIAQGAQNLAEGSTEQAASVEELSASIADVHQQTQTNAKNADRAMEATQRASTLMDETMNDLVLLKEAMQNISDDSAAISKVIKVIDEIASKTSLLSLNASVEAARVGQHGRGFAVVADEVRALATQSTEAAKQTATLIEGSAKRVQEGNDLLVRTDGSIQAVGEQTQISSQLIAEIAQASQEQASAISEINVGIDQISTVVQGNSATSQESAAAAQEMSSQSSMLNEIVQRFKLKGSPALEPVRGGYSAPMGLPRGETSSSAAPMRQQGLGKY